MFSLGLQPPDISWGAFISEVRSDPLSLFQFLIPLLIIVAGVISLRVRGAKTKINANPSMVQERENFELPDDYFSKEMMYVINGDRDHFEQSIENSSNYIIRSTKAINRFARRYKRLKYRLQYTNSNRKKKRLEEQMKIIMNEMIRMYGEVEKNWIRLDLKKLGDE